MKKIKSYVSTLLVLIIICTLLGTLSVSAATRYTLNVGETKYLSLSATSSKAIESCIWESNDPDSVDIIWGANEVSCQIKAVAASSSTTIVQCTYYYWIYSGTHSYIAQGAEAFYITVNSVDAKSISLSRSSLSLDAGSSHTLSATVSPSNATGGVSWSSSNSSVASVSSGTIYARSPGSATITARTSNGLTAKCSVTVNRVLPTSVSVSKQAVSIETGKTYSLSASLSPSYATSSITWSSNKTSVASVDSSGKVTAKAEGTATIIAKTENGLTSSCTVTVEKPALRITSISPSDQAKDILLDTSITVKFDETASESTNYNSISLKNANTNVSFTKTLSGNTLTIKPNSKLDYKTTYTLTIPVNSLKGSSGEKIEVQTTSSFTTISGAPKTPVISPDVSTINPDTQISITCATNGASIYYTTDGGNPAVDGILYTGKFTISEQKKATVRAIAVKNGFLSEETYVQYTLSGYFLSSQKNFGGKDKDFISKITAVSDGVIAVGYSYPNSFQNGDWNEISGKGELDAFILKYDNSGNIVWKKNFGGSEHDYFYAVTTVSDGVIAVGSSYSASSADGDFSGMTGKGSNDAIIVKYDFNGNIVWKKIFGGSSYDYYRGVTTVSDGVIAVGSSYYPSFGNGDWIGVDSINGTDAIIVKYDFNGNVVWKKIFGGNGDDCYQGITTVSDGVVAIGYSDKISFGHLFGTWSSTTGKGNEDAIIVKYDFNGNIVWKKNFGGSGRDFYCAITTVPDGVITIGDASYSSFGTGDWSSAATRKATAAVVVKYDNNGNVVWKKISDGLAENNLWNYSYGIAKMPGGVIAGGNGIIVNYDNYGNVVWKKTFSGSDCAKYAGFASLPDGIIAAGNGRNNDAIIDKYQDIIFYKPNINISANTLQISGRDSISPGSDFTENIYYMPSKDTAAVNLKLKYPSYIKYKGFTSEYADLSISEYSSGGYNYLSISADFTYYNSTLTKNSLCSLADLVFTASDSVNADSFDIQFVSKDCSVLDTDLSPISIAEYKNISLAVLEPEVKELFISGEETISSMALYKYATFPDNAQANITWSVSDSKIATVNQHGVVIPKKNGTVNIIVTAPNGVSKSFPITVTDMKAYINTLTCLNGAFDKSYSPNETDRTLYVPHGTNVIRLTSDFDGTVIKTDSGTMYSNVEKQFTISSLPAKITLTLSATGYDDTIYTINVTPYSSPKFSANVSVSGNSARVNISQINIQNAKAIAVLYDNTGKMQALSIQDISTDMQPVDFSYIKNGYVKVFVWESAKALIPMGSAIKLSLN